MSLSGTPVPSTCAERSTGAQTGSEFQSAPAGAGRVVGREEDEAVQQQRHL